MQILRMSFSGMWSHEGYGFLPSSNYFTRLFSTMFEVTIVADHSDIHIYSVYGPPPSNISSQRMIYFPNEVSGCLYEQAIQQNYQDYADCVLTCNPISSKDIFFPHFLIYLSLGQLPKYIHGSSPSYLVDHNALQQPLFWEHITRKKFGISAFINNPSYPRDQIIRQLSNSFSLDSYGTFKNNTYGPYGGDEYDKIRVSSKYTHTLAIENCKYPGYTSEKLLHAIAAGTIPIYWGSTETLSKYFNSKLIIILDDDTILKDQVNAFTLRRTKEIFQLLANGISFDSIMNKQSIQRDFRYQNLVSRIISVLQAS